MEKGSKYLKYDLDTFTFEKEFDILRIDDVLLPSFRISARICRINSFIAISSIRMIIK